MISSIDNFSDEQFVWVGIGIKARPGSAYVYHWGKAAACVFGALVRDQVGFFLI